MGTPGFPEFIEKGPLFPRHAGFYHSGDVSFLPETLVLSIAVKHKYYLVSETC